MYIGGDIYHSLKKNQHNQSQYSKHSTSWGSIRKENRIFLSQPRTRNEEVISLHTASFSTQLQHSAASNTGQDDFYRFSPLSLPG